MRPKKPPTALDNYLKSIPKGALALNIKGDAWKTEINYWLNGTTIFHTLKHEPTNQSSLLDNRRRRRGQHQDDGPDPE